MKRLSGISVALILVLSGCARSTAVDDAGLPPPPPIPATEVSAALQSLSDQMQRLVQITSLELETAVPTDAIRRTTLGWRIRTFEICTRARSRDNALAGLIELWFWSATSSRHYSTGAGKSVFGTAQQVVIERSNELEGIAEKMVRRAVPPERFEELKKQILAATVHGQAYLAGDSSKSDPLGNLLETTKLSSLLSITLSPFNAFSGVKAGGDAAARMAVTADRAVDMLVDYPKLLNWYMQKAMLEIQAQDTPQALLTELKRTNNSIEALTTIARNLPAEIRTEGVALLDQSRPAQADVRATLAALTEAANALERLNTGITQLITSVTPTPTTSPSTSTSPSMQTEAPGRPFDIREYTTALNAATVTAEKLQGTLQVTQALIQSPAITTQVASATDHIDGLISKIGWWLLAVIVTTTICVYGCVRLLRASTRKA
jgi:hypothetical protein